jgi:hypothetical protein
MQALGVRLHAERSPPFAVPVPAADPVAAALRAGMHRALDPESVLAGGPA